MGFPFFQKIHSEIAEQFPGYWLLTTSYCQSNLYNQHCLFLNYREIIYMP